ncbi:hypothetical protein [Immundisolibacter sp.]
MASVTAERWSSEQDERKTDDSLLQQLEGVAADPDAKHMVDEQLAYTLLRHPARRRFCDWTPARLGNA